jgi:hypothetical protein
MADPLSNVIQHVLGFPRIIRTEAAEREALYAMVVSLGATKLMAERLMQGYPHHAGACEVIVDFASDGEAECRARSRNWRRTRRHGAGAAALPEIQRIKSP